MSARARLSLVPDPPARTLQLPDLPPFPQLIYAIDDRSKWNGRRWIIDPDPATAAIYIRHELTSAEARVAWVEAFAAYVPAASRWHLTGGAR